MGRKKGGDNVREELDNSRDERQRHKCDLEKEKEVRKEL